MTTLINTKLATSARAIPVVRLAAVLTSGVLAGAFAYGWLIVFPTFFDVPTDIQLEFRVPLMNRNAPLMPPLMAAVLLSCAALATIGRGRERLVAAVAGASALACLLVTYFGNVPLNKQIKTWDPEALPANSASVLHHWNIYNDLRSIAALAPFLLVVTVLLPAITQSASAEKS
ncbi:anthrone oxygenase family protein [Nocardia sp. CA-129566]|uniref:anthrone oxygenase family protein n=1 Tax=Nocardia sp. CA-129566 TaxID=3239976 RepID=UPI003D9764A7